MKIQRRSLKTDKQTYSVNKKKFWRTDFCMIVVFYHNNTREKMRHFYTCVWYRQSAADTSLAFRAIRSGWWMNGKAFTIFKED